jgi:hypothetical protein
MIVMFNHFLLFAIYSVIGRQLKLPLKRGSLPELPEGKL